MQPQRCASERQQPMTNGTVAHYDVLAFQGPRVVDMQVAVTAAAIASLAGVSNRTRWIHTGRAMFLT
jgi:hypothetical protein